MERSDTCRFVRRLDGWQVSSLDLPYGLGSPMAIVPELMAPEKRAALEPWRRCERAYQMWQGRAAHVEGTIRAVPDARADRFDEAPRKRRPITVAIDARRKVVPGRAGMGEGYDAVESRSGRNGVFGLGSDLGRGPAGTRRNTFQPDRGSIPAIRRLLQRQPEFSTADVRRIMVHGRSREELAPVRR